MENILNYAIQINVLLSVVYLGYVLLLKNLTFYLLNRIYFIVGILFSFVYPFLDIQSWFRKPIPSVGEIAMDWSMNLEQDVEKSVFTLNNLLLIVLIIGVTVLSIRFLIQMVSLLRIHIYSEPAQWQSYLFRNVFIPIVPFSFLNKIYVNRDHHAEPELLDIFKHEDIHVKGLHSIDILISEFTLISSWFNPFVWFMRKAIRENLEFLTDQQVLNNGVDRQTYQYSLLRVNSNGSAALGNQFSFKTLKRRIMMMNKKRSAKIQISKYAFMLPIFVLTAGAFTLKKAEAKIAEAIDATKDISLEPIVSAVQSVDIPISQDTVKEAAVSVQDTLKGKVLGIKVTGITDSISGNNGKDVVSLHKDVLFILDGKKIDDIHSVDPNNIENITVLKGKEALALYGGKGKDGVILVTTKSGGATFSVKSISSGDEYKHTSKGFINAKGDKIGLILLEGKEVSMDEVNMVPEDKLSVKSIHTGEKAIQLYGEKGKNGVVELRDRRFTIAVQDTSTRITIGKFNSFAEEPLYIVDGEIANHGIGSIKTENIESMEIIKGSSAQALYGKRGGNGVVLLTTKTLTGKNQGDLKADVKKLIKREITKERERRDSVKTLKGGSVDQVNVIGYKKTDDDFYAIAVKNEKLKKFLNDNKGNINTKDGYVLVINGKVAREADLKKIDAKTVTKVMATDLTAKNSDLPKDIIGLLALESSVNKKEISGVSASVGKNGKEIKLMVNKGDQNPRIVIN